jgi:polar amino acid transport system substrate-binding protein
MKTCKWPLLSLVAALLMTAGTAFAGTLSIRADYWPPFNNQPSDVKSGYMIDVLREIFTPLGITIDYQIMSWADSLEAAGEGSCDAVIGASRSEAPGFIYPVEAFGTSGNMFFVRKGNAWTYKGVTSLKAIRLGIIEAYSYSDELDEYIQAHTDSDRIIEASGEEPLIELIGMLRNGQVDAVVEDPSVMTYALLDQKVPLGQVVRAGASEEKEDIFIAFSPARKTSKTYARQFDEGLRKLRDSGRLKQILGRYGLVDWK